MELELPTDNGDRMISDPRAASRRPVLLAFALTCIAAFTGTAGAQELDVDRLEHVADSMAYHYIAEGEMPGVTLAVAQDGEVLFRKGYGVADAEMEVAAGPETVYRIGSLTKQFTAAAVMRMVEEGELSLDDPITDYLPDYPTQGHTVTIRHLLNHTSGIRSYTSLGEDFWAVARLDLSEDELMDLFADLEFDFEPGADYNYNNSAYYLLGVILGKVTGTPYPQYIERSLMEPLGLDRTLYCDTRRIVEDRAHGYAYDHGELVNAEFISMANPGAAGALCSTVGDLVRWTELLFDGHVVRPSSLEAMTTPTGLNTGDTASYGFGLGLGEMEGHRRIAHGGGINGFASYLSRYPEADLTIAVLTNASGGNASGIEQALARTALGLDLMTIDDLPLSDAEMRRYTGRFVLQVGGDAVPIRFFAEDGHLYAQVEGQSANRLRYQGDDEFVPDFDDNVRMVFEGDGPRADAVTLYQGGGEYRGEREK